MALGLTITRKADTLHLVGWLDESADLQPLLEGSGPLKLNLRELKAINSLGLRRLIEVMRVLGDRVVEFHECSPIFIEAVNTVPLAVGGQRRIGRIKSAMLPLLCEDQHRRMMVMPIETLQVDQERETVDVPEQLCAVCSMPLFLEDGLLAEDYFFFLLIKPD